MRPADKARRLRIPGVFEEGAIRLRQGFGETSPEPASALASGEGGRRRAGCSVGRMQPDLHHGLLAATRLACARVAQFAQ
jgi:hypothetical protein